MTYTLTDSSGTQVVDCSFRVTVEDNEAPVIPDCSAGGLFGSGFTIEADAGECFGTFAGILPATDNCELAPEAYIVFTRPDGSKYEDTLTLNGSQYDLAANQYEVGAWSYVETVYDAAGMRRFVVEIS